MAHIVDVRNAGGEFVVLGDAFTLPTSNNATTPSQGSLRFNPTTQIVEVYNPFTASWSTVSGLITLSGDVIGNGTNNIVTTLANTGVTAGVYGSATFIPSFTVNSKGLITSVSTYALDITGTLGYTPLNKANASVSIIGDASGTASFNNSNNVSVALTLATSGVSAGSFGGATVVPAITVNSKGLITHVTATNISFPVTSVFGRTGIVILTSSDVTTALGYTPVNNAVLGVANGVATLDNTGKLTISQLPDAITGALVYQGTWNANTNTPTLTSGSGTKGWFYTVSVAGSTTINGLNQWNVGDQIVFNGTIWEKIDGLANEVVSVFGRTGNVILTSSDVTTALGYTPQGAFVVSGDVSGTATQNAVTLTLASSGVTAGTYGSGSQIPTLAVDSKGRITSVTNTPISVTGLLGFTPLNEANASVSITGDATGSASFNNSNAVSVAITLKNTGTIGTYSSVTTDAQGRVVSGGNISVSGDATGTVSGTSLSLTLATVNSSPGTFGTATQVPTITVDAKGLVTSITTAAINFPVTSVGGSTGTVLSGTFTNISVTGNLTAPTVANTDNSTNVATTAWVYNFVSNQLIVNTVANLMNTTSYPVGTTAYASDGRKPSEFDYEFDARYPLSNTVGSGIPVYYGYIAYANVVSNTPTWLSSVDAMIAQS